MHRSQFHVLIVDDNFGDAMLAEECLRRTNRGIVTSHVPDGEQCMAYLRREGRYQNARSPDLILLDINMPKMSGHQVMEELLGDETLRQLVVVVFSTSDHDNDVRPMLQRRCNSHIVKPTDLLDLQQVVQGLCDYWFGIPGLIVSPRA